MRGCWWVMAALWAAVPGCSSSGPFECADDTQCVISEAHGSCEVNGYCSFPDPSCPSGRRFGSLAPSDIRQLCVPPEASTESQTSGPVASASASSTSMSGSSTNGSTSSTTQPLTGPGVTTDVTTSSDDETATPTTGSTDTGDTTTTGPPPPCLSDEFDDGVFDPIWVVLEEDNVEEAGGELRLTLSPPAGGFPGVRSHGRDFTNAWMQAELGTPPVSNGAQIFLALEGGENHRFAFVVHPDILSLRRSEPGELYESLLDLPFDIVDHRWLRFQVVDEVLSFQVAGEVGQWSTLLETDAGVDLSVTRMTLAATDWADIPDVEIPSYRSFEYCDESLL